MTNQLKVTVYSTPNCGPCKIAKEFLSSHAVEFESIDVASDPRAMEEMVEKTGSMGTPVIIIGDEVVRGWDRSKVSRLLNLYNENRFLNLESNSTTLPRFRSNVESLTTNLR
jgi:glutaredoxin 3